MRPPPLPVGAAPSAVGGSLGLKIGLGVGIGLVAVVLLGGGAWGLLQVLGRGGNASVASVESKEPVPPPTAKSAQEKNPDSTEVGPAEPPEKQSPKVVPVKPAEPPFKNGPPTGTERTTPGPAPTNASATTTPAVTPPASTAPPAVSPPSPEVTPTVPASPATTPTAGSPLDDVRQRGNFLLIPEPKITSSVELAKIEVAKPADCDLVVLGVEDLLPMGQAIKLDRADAADKRTWTVSLKGNGSLNKDRAVADFTLSGKTLAFQWRPGAAAGSLPLNYCLLEIDAGGEKELCRLAKPIPLKPLKITPGETASIEFNLPVGIALKGQVLRLEVTPIDFPSVQFQANQGLPPGKNTTMTVTGSASGTLPPDLEVDVKFECTGGKAIIKLASTAPWPPDAKGKSTKGKVSAALLDSKKKEVAKKVTSLQKKKTLLEGDMDSLLKEQKLLAAFMPRTFDERNQLAFKQTQLTQDIVNVQTLLDTATAQHDAAAASVNWCDDMLALLKELDAKSRLGIRIYREVGKEVVEIIAADATAAP